MLAVINTDKCLLSILVFQCLDLAWAPREKGDERIDWGVCASEMGATERERRKETNKRGEILVGQWIWAIKKPR